MSGAVLPGAGTLALPFDQYQRYRLVADLVERVRTPGTLLRVLDVGGATGLLRRFLPHDRVFAVDVYAEGADPRLVLADGSRLPFRPDSFDVVAAFDTLEHVPPALRETFVAETARVARGWVLLAGPYHTPEVAAEEVALDRFLDEQLGVTHRFLREHLTNGLPDADAVERGLAAAGARVTRVGHGGLDLWQSLMRLELLLDEPPLRELGAALFELYARDLFAADTREPVYRHVVIGAFGDAALPAVEGLFASVPEERSRVARAALVGTLDVLAGSDERRAWSAEREQFKGVVADVQADLAGHRAALAETGAELDRHRAALAEYRERVRELKRKTPSGRWRQLLETFGVRRPSEDAESG